MISAIHRVKKQFANYLPAVSGSKDKSRDKKDYSETIRVKKQFENSKITSRWSVGPRTSLGTKKPRDLRDIPCEETIR